MKLRPLLAGLVPAVVFSLVLAASAGANHNVLERVSAGTPGPTPKNAAFAAVSNDGTRMLFDTTEPLAAGDSDTLTDIYERHGTVTTLMTPGTPTKDALFAGASTDGSRVFFHTQESLDATNDTDALYDVYERSGGTTTLISRGTASGAAKDAFLKGYSDDGTRVFFETAQSLDSGDGDTQNDVYERTNQTTTSWISQGPTSAIGTFFAFFKGASADGTHVFFETNDKLVSTDMDSSTDVYERTGGTTTTRVSFGPDGGNGTFAAGFDAVSEDGTRVLFRTNETLISADDGDGFSDVYARQGGTTTTLVSTGPNAGGPDSRHAEFAGSSADATTVIFETDEPLTVGDSDDCDPSAAVLGCSDVYQRTGSTTSLVSIGPGGGNGAFPATALGISENGSKILFDTQEKLITSGTPNDSDGAFDVYERANTTTTTLISTGPNGGNANQDAFFDTASADGSRVFFDTDESLITADADTSFDIYERTGGTTTLLSKGTLNGNGAFDVTYTGATPDASSIFFHSNEVLTADESDAVQDVFRAGITVTTGYVRPKGATPMLVSLVPSFTQCTGTPNRRHLDGLPNQGIHDFSCNPVAATTPYVTVGSPDANGAPANMIGSARLDVCPVPGCAVPNVTIDVDLADIRCGTGVATCGNANAAAGADYTGQLSLQIPLRITDRNNTVAGSGTDPATVVDTSLTAPFTCSNTTSNTTGATCSLTTTANAVLGGAAVNGQKAIWEVPQLRILDGGPDGMASTTAGNQTFAVEGVFIP